MSNIASLGFLGTGNRDLASFGFLGVGATPTMATVVGGGGDKAKRDREACHLTRRLKMKKARELARAPQTRIEPVTAPVIGAKVLDFRPQAQLFRAVAGPQQLQAPKAAPIEPLPPVPDHHDDEDIYLLTE